MTISSHEEHAADARRRLVFVDLLCVAAGILLALAVARPMGIQGRVGAHPAELLLLGAFGLATVLQLGRAGQYRAGRRFDRLHDVQVVGEACLVGAALTVLAVVMYRSLHPGAWLPSDGFMALGMGAACGLLTVSRLGGARLQLRAFRNGRYLARMLVVGNAPEARQIIAFAERSPELGVRAVHSAVGDDDPVAAAMGTFLHELDAVAPDEVVLAFADDDAPVRAAVARETRLRGIDLHVLPALFERHADLPFAPHLGIPVTTLGEGDMHRVGRAAKHAADQLLALVLLVALAPLLGCIALAIKLEDGGPVIFAQLRVGERGRRFRLRKFRTMHIDAEARLQELLACNEADGPIFKLRDDPRITRVGRLLRRTSLDELPQLWNVAFGDMSLVGPRPALPSEVERYEREHLRRLLARPGMTGLWQVSGRSDTTFEQMVELDLHYVEHQSMLLDLRILARTAVVVLQRDGAY